MNKTELVREIANKSKEEVTQKQVSAILEALPEVVIEVLKAGDDVTLPNLGKMSVKDVPERRGKIMMGERKGEEYVVEAHREPKMKLTKSFKECLL